MGQPGAATRLRVERQDSRACGARCSLPTTTGTASVNAPHQRSVASAGSCVRRICRPSHVGQLREANSARTSSRSSSVGLDRPAVLGAAKAGKEALNSACTGQQGGRGSSHPACPGASPSLCDDSWRCPRHTPPIDPPWQAAPVDTLLSRSPSPAPVPQSSSNYSFDPLAPRIGSVRHTNTPAAAIGWFADAARRAAK